jgi:hypothetical protein
VLTVAQIVAEACARCNLPPPPSPFVSSNDGNAIQLKALFNELMQETVKRYRFQTCIFNPTWTSVAANIQGTIQSLWGMEPESLVNATMWDFTLRRPIFGPLNDTNIQIIQALIPTGPIFQYRIQNNNLEIWPTPPAGNTHSAIVRSKNWLNLNGNSATPGYYIQNDTDTPMLDDTTMIMGLKYRFKKEKGLPYAEDYESWTDMIDQIALRDGSKSILYLDKASQELVPGIFVPSGNWSLSGGS